MRTYYNVELRKMISKYFHQFGFLDKKVYTYNVILSDLIELKHCLCVSLNTIL